MQAVSAVAMDQFGTLDVVASIGQKDGVSKLLTAQPGHELQSKELGSNILSVAITPCGR